MGMPWQLKEGLRRRVKGSPPRPIAEQLPSISSYGLPVPRNEKVFTFPDISLRYPHISSARLARDWIEFRIGRRTQGFDLKHIRTGFGIRHAFVCDCGRPTYTLYCRHQHIACRRCCNAIYASQALSKQQRPVLQASRIDSFLNKPRLFKRTKERLTKRLGHKVMLAQTRMGTDGKRLLD